MPHTQPRRWGILGGVFLWEGVLFFVQHNTSQRSVKQIQTMMEATGDC